MQIKTLPAGGPYQFLRVARVQNAAQSRMIGAPCCGWVGAPLPCCWAGMLDCPPCWGTGFVGVFAMVCSVCRGPVPGLVALPNMVNAALILGVIAR